MAKVYIKTYGCQMNERDSEQVGRMLESRGYSMTVDEADADVILLNTCSVRDMAEQKAIGKMGMMRRLRERKPHLVFGYLGCMAQSRGAELLDSDVGVDLVVGTQKFHRVADYIDELLNRRQAGAMDDVRQSIVDVDAEEGSQNTIRDHALRDRQVSAFVSIMQGCNMHCAFCIVPSTRGAERSRPIAEIVDEVRGLVERGVKEVTLLGQIVNLYGRHEFERVDDRSPFVQLLNAVHDVDGLERLRFTSPHPIGFRKDLVEAFARLPKLMEHVHLPVQSGSNRVLKDMRRAYTRERFLDLVAQLRASRPGLALTTDIIVGYPGESDDDFQSTIDLAKEADFDNAFVFRYSKRRDTPAAERDDQIPEPLKMQRNRDLLAVINANMERKLRELIGSRVQILCEGTSKTNSDRLFGRTRTNKIVVFHGADRHIGEVMDLRIVEASTSTLYGDPAILG